MKNGNGIRHTCRDAIRGCGYLPYVGNHPGTAPLIAFLLIAAVLGAQSSEAAPFLSAVSAMLIVGLPLSAVYLSGAVSRARLSDRHSGSSKGT